MFFFLTFLLLNHFLSPWCYHSFGTSIKPTPPKRKIMKRDWVFENIVLVSVFLCPTEKVHISFSPSAIGHLGFLEFNSVSARQWLSTHIFTAYLGFMLILACAHSSKVPDIPYHSSPWEDRRVHTLKLHRWQVLIFTWANFSDRHWCHTYGHLSCSNYEECTRSLYDISVMLHSNAN